MEYIPKSDLVYVILYEPSLLSTIFDSSSSLLSTLILAVKFYPPF